MHQQRKSLWWQRLVVGLQQLAVVQVPVLEPPWVQAQEQLLELELELERP